MLHSSSNCNLQPPKNDRLISKTSNPHSITFTLCISLDITHSMYYWRQYIILSFSSNLTSSPLLDSLTPLSPIVCTPNQSFFQLSLGFLLDIIIVYLKLKYPSPLQQQLIQLLNINYQQCPSTIVSTLMIKSNHWQVNVMVESLALE